MPPLRKEQQPSVASSEKLVTVKLIQKKHSMTNLNTAEKLPLLDKHELIKASRWTRHYKKAVVVRFKKDGTF